MPDNKDITTGQDRARVAAEQPYEVAYFANKHGLTPDEAKEIIREHGPSRDACDAAASRRRSS